MYNTILNRLNYILSVAADVFKIGLMLAGLIVVVVN